MVSYVFEKGIKMLNATGKKAIPTDQEELDTLIGMGYEVDPTGPQPKQKTVAPAAKSSTGKRHVDKVEASRIADANLAESLGMPGKVADQGLNAEFEAKVVSFIEQSKKSGKGVFMSTQIEVDGTKFCILFDNSHNLGEVLKCKLVSSEREDGTFATRSKLTVEVL